MRSFRSDQEEARKYSEANPLGLISMTLSLPSKENLALNNSNSIQLCQDRKSTRLNSSH